jgi:hypothetical protein
MPRIVTEQWTLTTGFRVYLLNNGDPDTGYQLLDQGATIQPRIDYDLGHPSNKSPSRP